MHHSPEGYSKAIQYRVNPAHRNWQRETSLDLAQFLPLCFRNTLAGCAENLRNSFFYRNYRPLLQETGRLVSDFISVCLETRWLGQKKRFLCAGLTL